MPDIYDSAFSETDDNNNQAAPNGFPEGMPPSGLNNGARALMGALKRWLNQRIPATTGGTSSAYTIAYSVVPTALADGMTHRVLFNATNTVSAGITTLNVNALGAKPIYKFAGGSWVSVVAGDILANSVHDLSYNASSGTYRIISSASLIGATFTTLAQTFSALQTFSAGIAMSGSAINEASASIASAASVNIGAAAANYLTVTGTTTITAFDTVQAGTERTLEFAAALTLTNGGALILPTGANITTAAGDTAIFRSEGTGNWRCISYQRADGSALAGQRVSQAITSTATFTGTYSTSSGAAPTTAGGAQIATQSFTSKSASSTIEIEVVVKGAAGGSDAFMLALFDGTTLVDCGVNYYTSAPGISQTFVLKTWYASPGVSARTFTVRLGANSGTSWALNNINTGAGFSPQSSIKSWLTIREIFP